MASILLGGIATSASLSLRLAAGVFNAASDTAIVDVILLIIHRSLEALTDSLTGAALIWRGIFTNGTNKASVTYILDNLPALFIFLYDLFKPVNVVPRYPAVMGGGTNGDTGNTNPYNELDLRVPVNRFAVVYQVQRVALTLVQIIKVGRDKTNAVPPNGLSNLDINAELRSDFNAQGKPPAPTYTALLEEGQRPRPDEKWLFINGIANEYVWFQRSCDKIRDTFHREVKGVYNRGDGILWDLIECCGERSTTDPQTRALVADPKKRENALIARTASSTAAQNTLVDELKLALWPEGGAPAPRKVVMIAHSQGVLILRLALQQLAKEYPTGSQKSAQMRDRLRVFTFGNPSVDWRATDELRSLSEFTTVTEHFAHRDDFVARLGVVEHRDDDNSGYDRNSVFYSLRGRGHLFGAHYPLGAEEYEDGARSRLLRAVDGNDII